MKSAANKEATKSVNAMMGMKNKLDSNVAGAVVHGVELAAPYQTNKNSNVRKSALILNDSGRKPDMRELDAMLKSFKPGLEEDERLNL